MLVAFVIWLMAKFGVTVTPERMHELEAEFYGRPALVNVRFARVLVPHEHDLRIIGIGYERHLGTQRYVGLGFLADALLPREDGAAKADYMLGAQLYVHPIKQLELTYAIGAYWRHQTLDPLNRFGIGYRVTTLHIAPVPSFWLDLVGKEPRYVLGAQIEF